MAYRDMNGKVMIDEAAAQADIRQERQAEQILRRAANALQAVQNESNSFQGETAAAIGERAEQLRRQILNLIPRTTPSASSAATGCWTRNGSRSSRVRGKRRGSVRWQRSKSMWTPCGTMPIR